MNVPRFDIAQNSPGLREPDAPQSPKRNVKWKATKVSSVRGGPPVECVMPLASGITSLAKMKH